jgi:uncharacterized Zn-binding protein involved in type VI secretion
MERGSVDDIGQGLDGDLTTTGAVCITSLPCATQGDRGVLRLGDKTTPCSVCGKPGVIVDSLPSMEWDGIATVLDGAEVKCGCPPGTNRLIAPLEGSSPALPETMHSTVAPLTVVERPDISLMARPAVDPAEKFARAFTVIDRATGERLGYRRFVALVDGHEMSGMTDHYGVAYVHAMRADSVISIHVLFQSPARALTEFSEGAQ